VAGRAYLDAVARSGGLALVVAPQPLDEEGADAVVAAGDGLLLLGGPDVEPARYGRPTHPRTYGVDARQDAFEVALLDAALRAGLPVLAICRGLQLVNVAHGGTLHQHLGDIDGLLGHAPATFPAAEPGSIGSLLPVTVQPGCRLHRLLGGTGTAPVSVVGAHSHHQAVDTVGPGLVVVGESADGVVEALEHPGHWLVAVQWHPEDTAATDPVMQRLFDGFVARAAGRA
jgi:putative glutamine amidotransferase